MPTPPAAAPGQPPPPLSRMPREPHAPAPHPGTAVLPAAVTTTMLHRCCPSGINVPSLLLSPGCRGRATDACGLIEGLTHTPEELSDSLGWPGERRGVQIAHSCHMSPVPSYLRTSLIPIGALPQGRTGRPDAGPKGTARLATVRSAGPGPAPSTSSTWPLFGCSTSAWSRHPVPTRHRLRACATRDSNPVYRYPKPER